MSDTTVAAPVVETTAPAPASAPAAAPEPQAQPEQRGPLSFREAKAAALESARGVISRASAATPNDGGVGTAGGEAPALIVDAQGRVHDPATGQFTSPPAADAAGEPEPAAAPGSQPDPVANQPAAQPQGIRVELPEGHPLREGGRTWFDAADEAQARDLRAVINGTYTRRQEAEHWQQQAQAYQQQLMRLQAEYEASTAWQQTALEQGVIEKYEAMKAVDPEAAETYLLGARLAIQQDADTRYQQAVEQAQAQADEQMGQRIIQDAYTEAQGRVPAEVAGLPGFDNAFHMAIQAYDYQLSRHLEMGGAPPSVEEQRAGILLHLQGALLADVQVRDVLTRLQAAERQRQSAEADRVQREQAVLQAVAAPPAQPPPVTRAPPHPIGSLGAGARAGVSVDPNAPDPAAGLSGNQLKKALSQRVRGLAGQYAQR